MRKLVFCVIIFAAFIGLVFSMFFMPGCGMFPPPPPPTTEQGDTGIKSFWTYDVNSIGGGGSAMVNLSGGNFIVQFTDVSFPGRGLPVEIRRTYNAQTSKEGSFGKGWTSLFDAYLEIEADTVILTDGYGGEWEFTNPQVDNNGNTVYTSPPGRNTVFMHRAEGSYSERKKNGSTYFFDSAGKLTKIQHRNVNNYLQFVYDGSGNLAEIHEASGRITTLEYSGTYVASITDPQGRSTLYTYSGSQLTGVTDPEGYQTQFEYNGEELLSKIINPRGYESTIIYNADNQVTQFNDPLYSVNYQYEQDHTIVTDTYGHNLTYYLNASGNNIQATDTMGYNTYFVWNNNMDITQVTNAKNQITNYTHDGMGNLLTVENPIFTTSYAYDEFHNLISSTDGEGHTTTFTYAATPTDPYKVLQSVATPMNRTVTFAYDTFAQPLTATNARGYSTGYQYDLNGNITDVTDAAGSTTTIVYNNVGEATVVDVPVNGQTQFTYDNNGLVTSVTTPSGATTSYSYGPNGNRLSINDPLNHTTSYTFNEDDRMVTVKDALDNVTTYTYQEGLLHTTRDPSGFTTTMAYDGNDRMASRSNPVTTENFTYDALGNVTNKSTGLGDIGYNYDSLNRLLGVTMSVRSVSFTYDNNGNRLSASVTDGGGVPSASDLSVSYGYDSDNRLVGKLKIVNGRTLESVNYDYDNNSNPTQLNMTVQTGLPPTPPDSSLINDYAFSFTWEYDALDRQTSVTNSENEVVTATYDAVGNMTEIHYPYDIVSIREFDAENRITRVSNHNPTLNPDEYYPHMVYEYTYDAAGNFTSFKQMPPDVVAKTYSYDALNRLIYDESSVMEYFYDAVGNKTRDEHTDNNLGLNYHYNSGHQLIRREPDEGLAGHAIEYEYDTNGCISKMIRKYFQPDRTSDFLYTHNASNRLTSLKHFAQVGVGYDPWTGIIFDYGIGREESYSYSADNELFYSEDKQYSRLFPDFAPSYSFINTFHGYESGALIYKNTVEGFHNASLNIDYLHDAYVEYYTYLNGLKVGMSHAEWTASEDYWQHSMFYMYDGQGNIVQREKVQGQLTLGYSSYGSPGGGSDSYESHYKGYDVGPFGYTDYYPYHVTYKTGVRMYDPETGRFLSPDPFKGYLSEPASQNPYMYCRGNPIKYFDPTGYDVILQYQKGSGKKHKINWKLVGKIIANASGQTVHLRPGGRNKPGKYKDPKTGNTDTFVTISIVEKAGLISLLGTASGGNYAVEIFEKKWEEDFTWAAVYYNANENQMTMLGSNKVVHEFWHALFGAGHDGCEKVSGSVLQTPANEEFLNRQLKFNDDQMKRIKEACQ